MAAGRPPMTPILEPMPELEPAPLPRVPLRAFNAALRHRNLDGSDVDDVITVIAADFYAASLALKRCYGARTTVLSLTINTTPVLIAKEDIGVED